MKKYPLLFLLSLLVYAAHFTITRHGIYGDGNGYFAIAHTLFFQHRLDFAPVYKYLSSFQGAKYVFSRVFWDTRPTATHILNAPWLIGTSLFWLPSFVLAWIPATLAGGGMFSPLYEAGCGITGILLVLGGLYFLEKVLAHSFGKKTAGIAVLAVFSASQLFYYASFEPALSHQPAFFLVCMYVYISTFYARARWYPAGAGLLAGVLFMTRPGDLALLLPFYAKDLATFIRENRKGIFFLVLSFLAGILPQILFQTALYGAPWGNPYLSGNKGTFRFPGAAAFSGQFFGLQGGLFLFSPLLAIAVWGLVRRRSYLPLVSLALYALFIASWDTPAPAGFGNRFYLSAIPLLLPGVAWFIRRYGRKALAAAALLVLWNLILLTRFYYFKV